VGNTCRISEVLSLWLQQWFYLAQRFGLPVVPEWADWFNAELSRRGAIRPLIGPRCSPVLVSDTKKIFLKCIGRALRRKQIRFPEENGPVRWTLSNSFFRVGETELEEANPEDAGKVILSIGLLSP
jgi:hypothetical protein